MIANATYNAAILTLPDYDMNGSLVVGEGFKGCILQGPGILFNETMNNGAVFGPCPAENKGCKDLSLRRNLYRKIQNSPLPLFVQRKKCKNIKI